MDVLDYVIFMNLPRKKNLYSVFFILILCFLTLRFWKITETLEFFSDIGRDHYILFTAISKKKPPLLGPSNSALPLNQSPVYYYLNLPVFLLSSFSPYTTLITLTLLFLASFIFIFYEFKDNKKIRTVFFLFLLLLIFHPEFVSQHRYPWNPTFTVPFLLVSIFMLFKEWKKRDVWIFSLCSAIAVGCSYSVLPTVVVLVGYALWKKKTQPLLLLITAVSSFFLVFLPLLIVELRTHFLLTKRLGIELQVIGEGVNYLQKIRELCAYMLGQLPISNWPIIFVIVILCACFFSKPRPRFILLFLAAAVLTILSPFRMGAHYIFGVTLLFFAVIASVQKRIYIPIFLFLLFLWIPVLRAQLSFKPRRSVTQIQKCAQQVCEKEKRPMFVSEQAWHSYHYAPDWLFLFAKNGCTVADVTQTPGFAKRMAVVVDQSSYVHEQTAFNELTLFGPATVDATYTCDGNISVVLLEQKTQ